MKILGTGASHFAIFNFQFSLFIFQFVTATGGRVNTQEDGLQEFRSETEKFLVVS